MLTTSFFITQLDQMALGRHKLLEALHFPLFQAVRTEKGKAGGYVSKEKRRLTMAIAVVDPLLPVLGWGYGFLQPCLFHNGAGILPGPLFQSP